MSSRVTRVIVVMALVFLAAPALGQATAPAVIGSSWASPKARLQSIIDAAIGPGRINVLTDYLGARAGDPDVLMWSSTVWPILEIQEISGAAHRADFGWYVENGRAPLIDHIDDGPVFKNEYAGPAATLSFRSHGRVLGFYLRTADAGSGLGPRTFFTNRGWNDEGPGGSGALHSPMLGGDVQALVFDISAWTQPNTWLVCFEDHDSGAVPGPCCNGTDNDYADYVFKVRAMATTDTSAPTFGFLKNLYRD